MIARLALLATLVSASIAQAAPPVKLVPADDGGAFTLRGKGVRGGSTLGGSISRDAAGKVSGEFVIMITTPDDTATACRYAKLAKVKKSGNTVTFDAVGKCFTVAPSGAITEWKASNAFAIVQGTGKTRPTGSRSPAATSTPATSICCESREDLRREHRDDD
jgi:hypothetical protein